MALISLDLRKFLQIRQFWTVINRIMNRTIVILTNNKKNQHENMKINTQTEVINVKKALVSFAILLKSAQIGLKYAEISLIKTFVAHFLI